MNKFVIKWRKFESKRSYINEDMIFLILRNFLDFILIFQLFFELFPHKTIAKRVLLFAKDPRS